MTRCPLPGTGDCFDPRKATRNHEHQEASRLSGATAPLARCPMEDSKFMTRPRIGGQDEKSRRLTVTFRGPAAFRSPEGDSIPRALEDSRLSGASPPLTADSNPSRQTPVLPESYPANQPKAANASRVAFSGSPSVTITSSSMRMPPKGRSSSTVSQFTMRLCGPAFHLASSVSMM